MFLGKNTVKSIISFETFIEFPARIARYATGLSKLRYMILFEPLDDPTFFELRSVSVLEYTQAFFRWVVRNVFQKSEKKFLLKICKYYPKQRIVLNFSGHWAQISWVLGKSFSAWLTKLQSAYPEGSFS